MDPFSVRYQTIRTVMHQFRYRKVNERHILITFNCFILIFIVVPCILITLKFLSPMNAPLYYTYKIPKYTARSSPDCSYMFRSTWTIIREPMPNLAKITLLWK